MSKNVNKFLFSLLAFYGILFVSIATAQNTNIDLSTGISVPIGVFSDSYSLGTSNQIGGEHRIWEYVFASVQAGFIQWPIKKNIGSDLLRQLHAPGVLDVNGSVHNIPIKIGLRYYNFAEGYNSFFGISAGINYMKGVADLRYDPQNGSPVISESVEESWSSSGYELSGGVIYPIGDSWSAETVVSYLNIEDWNHEIVPKSTGIPGQMTGPPQFRSVSVHFGIVYKIVY